VRPEELCQRKIAVTPSGIEPAVVKPVQHETTYSWDVFRVTEGHGVRKL
jgi:hypothetical protein